MQEEEKVVFSYLLLYEKEVKRNAPLKYCCLSNNDEARGWWLVPACRLPPLLSTTPRPEPGGPVQQCSCSRLDDPWISATTIDGVVLAPGWLFHTNKAQADPVGNSESWLWFGLFGVWWMPGPGMCVWAFGRGRGVACWVACWGINRPYRVYCCAIWSVCFGVSFTLL